jgi:DNA-binding transcriptional MerR regulator
VFPMISIGRLAKQMKISRTALLYYDSLGLLRPAAVSRAGYRMYSEQDVERLGKILDYRKTGLSLAEIRRLLDGEAGEDRVVALLLKRLGEINGEIAGLKKQQEILIRLIRARELLQTIRRSDPQSFTALLENAGIAAADYDAWHRSFETHSPELHARFLEAAGFSAADIRELREELRAQAPAPQGHSRQAGEGPDPLL